MDFGEYLMMLVKSYNPNQYHKLVEQDGSQILQFVVYTFAISLALFLCLLIPMAAFYVATIDDRIEPIQKFNIAAEIETTGPVALSDHPHVVLDLAANNTQPRTITLTKDGLHYPTLYLIGDSSIAWSSIFDMKNNAQRNSFILAAFLLPSIVFWIIAWFALKTVLLLSIFMLLAISIPRLFGYALEKGDALKIAIFASPSLFLFDFALSPIAPMFWWGVLLTTIYFFVAVLLGIEPMKKEIMKPEPKKRKQ